MGDIKWGWVKTKDDSKGEVKSDTKLEKEFMWITVRTDILIHVDDPKILELNFWHCVVKLLMLW